MSTCCDNPDCSDSGTHFDSQYCQPISRNNKKKLNNTGTGVRNQKSSKFKEESATGSKKEAEVPESKDSDDLKASLKPKSVNSNNPPSSSPSSDSTDSSNSSQATSNGSSESSNASSSESSVSSSSSKSQDEQDETVNDKKQIKKEESKLMKKDEQVENNDDDEEEDDEDTEAIINPQPPLCTNPSCQDANCNAKALPAKVGPHSCSDPNCSDTKCGESNNYLRFSLLGITGILFLAIIGYMAYLKTKIRRNPSQMTRK